MSSRLINGINRINNLLNHDFCPGANPYVYWLKQPVGWVISGAAASAFVGFFLGSQGFVLMWVFLTLLLIGTAWPWLCMKGIDCRLSFDGVRFEENGSATALFEITNRWPLPIFGLMIEGEFLLDHDEDDSVAVGLQRIPAWSTSRLRWAFVPRQRGVLPLGETIISSGFPFGIYQLHRKIDVLNDAIVWPENHDLQGTPGFVGAQFNISGMASDRPGVDGDVIGIRQFRRGDPLKHIHWSKTATMGRLIVQERQSFAQSPFEIIVDLCPGSHCGRGANSSYEWAIRIVSSVCSQLHRHQAKVSIRCVGLPAGFKSHVSNSAGLGQMMDYLATLPTLDDLQRGTLPIRSAHESFLQQVNQSRFIICTESAPEPLPVGGTLIRIDANQFGMTPDDSPQEELSAQQPEIRITSPGSAFNELQTGWIRRVCHEL